MTTEIQDEAYLKGDKTQVAQSQVSGLTIK